MRLYGLVVLIFIVQSCKESTCDWKGGEVADYGTYCNNELKLKVSEEDNYLKYEVRNNEGAIVIKNDENISVVQRWALFLDKDKKLWVFSSDIGHSCWIRDSMDDKY